MKIDATIVSTYSPAMAERGRGAIINLAMKIAGPERRRHGILAPMSVIELQVNGAPCRVECDPATPLLFVLRNDLGLNAAKYGCGLEQCGACAVLVGGQSTLSCRLPVSEVGAREVVTVEGLPALAGAGAGLHPVQRAFLAENAAQCAYCVPGILIAATALLAWNDDPTDAEIRRALTPHLCRCGAHPRILRAVRRAARELQR